MVGPTSMAVIEAVAAAEGADTTDLDPPLAAVVDPEALDSLIENSEGVVVEFDFAGRAVTVESDGAISLGDAAERR